jgi:hypothetical protein
MSRPLQKKRKQQQQQQFEVQLTRFKSHHT